MFSVPAIGSKIQVTTKFGSYVGSVVPNDKWDAPDSFCMTGDQYIAIRNIRFKSVVEIKSHDGSVVPTAKQVELAKKAWKVKSNGKLYLVQRENYKYTCNCTGFMFRKVCKHVQAAAKFEESK